MKYWAISALSVPNTWVGGRIWYILIFRKWSLSSMKWVKWRRRSFAGSWMSSPVRHADSPTKGAQSVLKVKHIILEDWNSCAFSSSVRVFPCCIFVACPNRTMQLLKVYYLCKSWKFGKHNNPITNQSWPDLRGCAMTHDLGYINASMKLFVLLGSWRINACNYPKELIPNWYNLSLELLTSI